MTHQEILEKAIQKAIGGGWKYVSKPESGWGLGVGQWSTTRYHLMINDYKTGDHYYHYAEFVFNRGFAQALWGERPSHEFAIGETMKGFDGEVTEYDFGIEDTFALLNWQYHLQQMVIADDPIAYLGEHL